MTLVDAEGRLLGRWNLVDAVVVVLAIGLIPIGYAAYALFRTPAPVLTAVEPSELAEGPNQRVTIRGVNLRPYLRVSFNTTQGATFLFEDSTKAVVDLNEMRPGTYDVILYDYGQERHRLPGALTIRPGAASLPMTEVVVAGRFVDMTAEKAAALTPGTTLADRGTVVEVMPLRASKPRVFFAGVPLEVPSASKQELPALLKLNCVVKLTQGLPECGGVDYVLRQHYVMQIPTPAGVIPFQIDQLLGTEPVRPVTVRVRLSGPADTLAVVAPGDKDVDLAMNELALGMTVVAVEPVRGSGAQAERMATLAVRAQRLSTGWRSGLDTLRASSQFMLRAEKYAVLATVLSIDERSRP